MRLVKGGGNRGYLASFDIWLNRLLECYEIRFLALCIDLK